MTSYSHSSTYLSPMSDLDPSEVAAEHRAERLRQLENLRQRRANEGIPLAPRGERSPTTYAQIQDSGYQGDYDPSIPAVVKDAVPPHNTLPPRTSSPFTDPINQFLNTQPDPLGYEVDAFEPTFGHIAELEKAQRNVADASKDDEATDVAAPSNECTGDAPKAVASVPNKVGILQKKLLSDVEVIQRLSDEALALELARTKRRAMVEVHYNETLEARELLLEAEIRRRGR